MVKRFESFVSGITACYRYIQKIKSTEMTEFGLKGTHVMCVFHLNRNADGLTASQLSSLCGEDKAAVSRALSELSEKGYINADSDETKKKYRSVITLTEKGEELAKKLDSLIDQWVDLGGDGLTDEERDTFYSALEKIANNLKTRTKEKA